MNHAQAASIDRCKIDGNGPDNVALGFPVSEYRLSQKAEVNILVAQFNFSDSSQIYDQMEVKKNYEIAKEWIEKFSNGKTKINFKFLPVIDFPVKLSEFETYRFNQRSTNWDDPNSNQTTWSFVRRFVKSIDSVTNFKNVDGLFIQGNSTSTDTFIAEAMLYTNRTNKLLLKPLETDDGEIYNAILLDKIETPNTIAHETMHMYGLPDLYGSGNGPGPLSLMSGATNNLLNQEKWVLGWLQDSNVQCFVSNDDLQTGNFQQYLYLDSFDLDKQIVIKTGSTKAFILQMVQEVGRYKLLFYSLDNQDNPPITLHNEKGALFSSAVDVSDGQIVGKLLTSLDFDLLINDFKDNKFQVIFFDHNLSTTELGKATIEKALNNRIGAIERYKESLKIRESKPESLPTPSPVTRAPNPALSKKITITCVKGKTTKKITAVAAVCPKGYTKKK